MTDALDLLRMLPAFVACGVLPGWWIAGALGLTDRFARLGAAVLLSALVLFALGVAWLAGGPGGLDPAPFVWALALGPAVLAAVTRMRARAPEAPTLGTRRWQASVLVLAAWTLLVFTVHAFNPELRYRIDGWFHGAVTGRLLALGLPPDDPYFAGQPLAYPWAWHVVLATTQKAGAPFGIGVFDALAGWSALAALALGAFLVALGRAWAHASGLDARETDRAGAGALLAAVVATNPLGLVFALGRGFLGHDAGLATFARPFERGATEVMLAETWAYPHVSLASIIDKFLTPTAFGLGMATFLAGGALLLLAPPRGVRTKALVLGTAVVAWLVHPAVAAGLAFLAVVGLMVLARVREARRRGTLLVLALAVGALVTAPYLLATRGGAGGGFRLAVRGDLLWSIVAVGAVVIALAWRERRRLPALPDGRHAWFAGGLALLLAAALVTLVQRNETKLVQLGLLALAVPAGVAWARLPTAAALALLALLVPTHAMAVAGFALERGQDTPGRRVPPPALAAAYAWIGGHTAPRDLFLEAQPATARDPDRDLLVHGPRGLVWGGGGYATNWGYAADDLRRRRRAATELAGGTLRPETVGDLAARAARARAQVYAVRRGAGGLAPLPDGSARWTRVYAGDGIALDRLDGVGLTGATR